MSGLTCQTADGTKAGGVCDVTGACTGQNLVCDQTTGLCKLSGDGKLGSPCQIGVLECDTKTYPGIACSTSDPQAQGTCVCSVAAKLCADNQICAKVPGPSPPPPSPWPDSFPNASDDEKKLFTGDCSASSWYTNAKGACPATNLGALNASGKVACLTTSTWQGAGSGKGYTNFCLAG